MGETITGLDLEKLSEGKLFDGVELIISNSNGRIETVHKEPGKVNISCLIYDVIGRKSVRYKGGSEVIPGEYNYKMYKKKLMEVGQWH